MDIRVTSIGEGFSETASGPFDGRYMRKLFAHGEELARAGVAFDPKPAAARSLAAR